MKDEAVRIRAIEQIGFGEGGPFPRRRSDPQEVRARSYASLAVPSSPARTSQADYGPLVTNGDFHSVVGDRERAVGTRLGHRTDRGRDRGDRDPEGFPLTARQRFGARS